MPAATNSIIDADIHPVLEHGDFFIQRLPEPWRSRWNTGNRGTGHVGYWNPNPIMRADAVLPDGSRVEHSAKNLAQGYLDPFDIEYGILNPANSLWTGITPEPDYASAVCSAINDTFAEEWLPVDSRLRASLMVSPVDPQLAAKEVRRMGAQPGFVQVYMASAARMPFGQRFYWPIYEAAAEHDLPIAIHPGWEGGGISHPSTPAGYPSSYFEWHTTLVCNYIGHLVSLVSEGVFQKFPKLKFVMLEGGVSWLPGVLWRIDKNWKGLRMTVPWLDRPPSEIIAEHILLTTQPMEEPDRLEHLHQMYEMFPAGKMIMFSSDFPHWDGDTPDFVARLLPPAVRGRIMSETARELYRLPAPKTSNV